MINQRLKEVLWLIENNKYIDSFILLNSINQNKHDEFTIDIPKYFRVGQIERKNHRGYMFHLYFIDVYNDSPRCHFYRTFGKLYINIDTKVEDIPEKDIKRYFVPQFIKMLRIYLKEENNG